MPRSKAEKEMNSAFDNSKEKSKARSPVGGDDESLTRCRQILGICLILDHQQGGFVRKWPKSVTASW